MGEPRAWGFIRHDGTPEVYVAWAYAEGYDVLWKLTPEQARALHASLPKAIADTEEEPCEEVAIRLPQGGASIPE